MKSILKAFYILYKYIFQSEWLTFNDKIFYSRAKVLYDKPADEFHPITLTEKNEFLQKLAEKYDVSVPYSPRSGFIVSSTSWTEDEDFSILLNALHGSALICICFIHNLSYKFR